MTRTSPVGLHRVLAPPGALPQAAERLDAAPEIGPDEVRVRVERLNLDAASFRQLATKHAGDGDAVRAEVLDIVATRGKMQNPVTGSGGMLVGVVDEVGPESPLGLAAGDRVATLVSLSLTPLRITDGLARWDGRSEQVPAEGHAILFGRSIAARLPDDLPAGPRDGGHGRLRRACPDRTVSSRDTSSRPSPSSAGPARAARCPWPPPAGREHAPPSAWSRSSTRRSLLRAAGLADHVALADARDPVALAAAVESALGRPRRHHGGLRRRARLRARGDPRHGGRRHGDLLLDGHLVLGGRPRCRGAGRRRHDARRQRLRPGPRRPRAGPAAHRARRPRRCSSGGWPTRRAESRFRERRQPAARMQR